MKIESITFQNFRQYIGTQTVQFSVDSNKKVTVLVGDNTSGKTTLIRAFEWCLYRKNGFNDPILLNKEVAQSMVVDECQEVVVSVLLWNREKVNGKLEDIRYKIQRVQNYICTGKEPDENGVLQNIIVEAGPMKGSVERLNMDGQTISNVDHGMVNKVINKILPQDLSDYFFIEGERVEHITDNEDLKEAVRGLMGLDVLEDSKRHLKKIVNAYNSALKKSGNVDIANAEEAKETKQKQLESIEKQIDEMKETISFYENEKLEAAAKLRQNQSVIDDQERREQLEKVIGDLESSTSSEKNAVVDAFSGNNSFAFYLKPIKGKIDALMDHFAADIECVPDMTQTSIDYIINTRHVCICGTHITEGSAAHQCLLMEKKKMPPENIGAIASRFKSYTSLYTSSADSYFATIEMQYKSYRSHRKELGFRREELQDLSKKIGKNDIDVKELNDRYNGAIKTLEEKNRELRKLYEQQGAIKREIANLDKSISQYLKADKVNSKLRNYLLYAQALYSEFNEEYITRESNVRVDLQTKVNEIFNRAYHGTRSISVNSRYQVEYLEKLDESNGLKAVKNLSFITGLIEMAKEDMNNDKGLVGVSEFPLVLDAPFSNIDGTHIKNLSSIIPTTADQVIIAVMKEHWDASGEEMSKYTGLKYQIKKDIDSQGNEKETATHFILLED